MFELAAGLSSVEEEQAGLEEVSNSLLLERSSSAPLVNIKEALTKLRQNNTELGVQLGVCVSAVGALRLRRANEERECVKARALGGGRITRP